MTCCCPCNLTKQKMGEGLLLCGGLCNLLIAALHIIIALIGINAFQYFGAPASLIRQLQQGQTTLVYSVIALLVVFFTVMGLYGLSGAGWIKRLPALKLCLILIGLLYTIRGSVVLLMPFPKLIHQLLNHYPNLLGMGRVIMPQDWLFSGMALGIGLCYLVGIGLTAKISIQ